MKLSPSIVAAAWLAILVVIPPAPAQQAGPPPVVAIKAARLFDGKSGTLRPNGVVLVQGPRIVAVGTDLAIPAGAEVLDLGDSTLSPGFIDAHTHLTGESTDDWKQQFVDCFRRETAEKAIESTVHARKVLEAGFTTVRDVGSTDMLDVSLRNAIARGLVPGPRMLVAVHTLGARGGHADESGLRHDLIKELGPAEGIAYGPDGFREAVRFQVKYGADVIKFCASGGVLSLADEVDTPQLSPEEMKALVDEAHRLRKKVAAHCHGDHAAREAIEAGVDSIEHGSFLTEGTLALMKQRGTYLVPTLLAGDWIGGKIDKFPPEIAAKAKAALAARSEMFRTAVRLGVKIGFGTDSAVSPHGINAREFALMTGLGMPPIAALRSATSVDAELLGIAAKVGTLEPGKLADIIAMPGDPTVDITATARVSFVMKEGKTIKSPRAATR
jgi:imidazolonepropionase-like amidohydrolase